MKSFLNKLAFYFFLISWFTMAHAGNTNPLPNYELEVTIIPESHLLKANLKLRIDSSFLQNNKLLLLINRNAGINLINTQHPAKVSVDSLDEFRNKIILDFLNLKEAEVVMNMTYTLVIPENHQVNRITEDWVELNIDSFWFPLIYTFPTFNYEMKLNLSSTYTVMTGDIKVDDQKNDHIMIKNRLPRLDISFSAAKKFYSVEGDFVKISSIHPEVKIDSVKIVADQALTFLNEYIDEPKDFKHKRTVVISPRGEVGYSRKNYVVLSDIKDKTAIALARFLSHEFAHYWFSEAALSSKHHWLSESFAEYISMIFIREKYSQQEFEDDIEEKKKRIEGDKKMLADYEGRPSHLALYFKGPLILYQFEQYLGEENFKILINNFVDKSISTNDGLYELIKSHFGTEAVLKLKDLRAAI